jgi:hypothetical protein
MTGDSMIEGMQTRKKTAYLLTKHQIYNMNLTTVYQIGKIH